MAVARLRARVRVVGRQLGPDARREVEHVHLVRVRVAGRAADDVEQVPVYHPALAVHLERRLARDGHDGPGVGGEVETGKRVGRGEAEALAGAAVAEQILAPLEEAVGNGGRGHLAVHGDLAPTLASEGVDPQLQKWNVYIRLIETRCSKNDNLFVIFEAKNSRLFRLTITFEEFSTRIDKFEMNRLDMTNTNTWSAPMDGKIETNLAICGEISMSMDEAWHHLPFFLRNHRPIIVNGWLRRSLQVNSLSALDNFKPQSYLPMKIFPYDHLNDQRPKKACMMNLTTDGSVAYAFKTTREATAQLEKEMRLKIFPKWDYKDYRQSSNR